MPTREVSRSQHPLNTQVRRRLFTVTIEGFDDAPAPAAAAAAASEPREVQAAGPSCALVTPAPAPDVNAQRGAAEDDVASGSGFAESGEEDGDGASNDGGGACARVPAAPGGAARLATIPCDGGGAQP